jgi:formylglycine-generating enzyme
MKRVGLAAVLAAAMAAMGGAVAAEVSCDVYRGPPSGEGETAGMVFIAGGTFRMGSESHQPEERFIHEVHVDGFWIDRYEVTNAQFRQFVDTTGYKTLAERGLDPKTHPGMPKELLVPGSVLFIEPADPERGRLGNGWQYVQGANWRRPAGPGSSIAGKDNHPVVHIAYEDALAYASWRGRSLPTEAQWERAARGGRDGEDDSSSAFDAEGKPVANTWQGTFPMSNTKEDGYAGTAPVGCFKPNGYGLYDMIGNVWEWTGDAYRPGHSREAAVRSGNRVIKGGSYLCAPNYCSRYRPAARQPQETDLSAAHLGFRTVLNKGKNP